MSDFSATTLRVDEGEGAHSQEVAGARERTQELLQGMSEFLANSRNIDRWLWAAVTTPIGLMCLAVWLTDGVYPVEINHRPPYPVISLWLALLFLTLGAYTAAIKKISSTPALVLGIGLVVLYLVVVFFNRMLPVLFLGAVITISHVVARPTAALVMSSISLLASAPLVLYGTEHFDEYPQLFRALMSGLLILVFLQFVSRSNLRFRREAFKVTGGLKELMESLGRSLNESLDQRGRAEQALRRALEVESELKRVGGQLEDAVQSMSQGLVMVGVDGRIMLSNPQAVEILGVPQAYLAAGRPFEDLLQLQSTRGELGTPFRVNSKAGQSEGIAGTPSLVTNTLRLSDGRHGSMSSRRMPSGCVVHTYTDVTDYVVANERLQTSIMGLSLAKQQLNTELRRAKEESDMKLRFVTAVSHEIRTPLNGIMGIVELLSRSGLDRSQTQWIEDAETSTRQLHRLTDDILDLSRIKDSKFTLNSMAFQLDEVIEKAVRAAQGAAEVTGNLLELQMVEAEVRVLGDAQRLTQIVNNLVYNAIKFTQQGLVRVHVESRQSDPSDGNLEVVLSVADSGRGIPADVLSSIFEPFHQGEESVNRNFGGSGLGLTLCRELCEAMGGGIRVTSRVGRGSVFTVTVFLKTAEPGVEGGESQPGSLDSSDPRSHISLDGKRILVVDDNRINQKLVHAWLEFSGAVVDVAADGAVGLRAASGRHYDCILMDMSMPVMNGLDATRAIRLLGDSDTEAIRLRAAVPIIGVTAMARREDQLLCLEAGMDAHLSKPLDRGRLLKTLREVLDAHAWLSEISGRTPWQRTSRRLEDKAGLQDA